jgi:hypothetical protein
MNSFHVSLHARPAGNWPREVVRLDGRELTRLVVPPEHLTRPLSVSFEVAAARLAALPRMFIEPDGSFVWVADESPANRCQVDGSLCDGRDSLQHIELKGSCTPAAWDQFLSALNGTSGTELLVQITRAAVFVEEREFRRMLTS